MSDAPLYHRYAPTPTLDNSPGDSARCRSGDPSDGGSTEKLNGHKEEDYSDEDLEDDDDLSRLERSMRDRRRAKSLPASAFGALYVDNGEGRKRVKFADSMGMDLAIVKHFSSLEVPQIPSKVLSRFRSFPPPPRQQERAAAAAIGDLCDSFTSGLSTTAAPAAVAPHLDRLIVCFPNPVEEDIMDRRLRNGRVALENVAVTPFDVRGHIRVLLDAAPSSSSSSAHHEAREVGVRYTFNDWLSHVDAQALPVVGSSSEHLPPRRYRLFSFTMYTPPFEAPGATVHFALYLRTEHGEFWDNNQGENYTLRYHCAPGGAAASFGSAAFQPT